MNIQPRPDQELKIQEAMKSGLIKYETDILDIGLVTLFKNKQEESITDIVDRLANFGKMRKLSLGNSTIKELINEGRL